MPLRFRSTKRPNAMALHRSNEQGHHEDSASFRNRAVLSIFSSTGLPLIPGVNSQSESELRYNMRDSLPQ